VPIAGQQHHLRPPDMLLRTVTVGDDRCQTRTIRRGDEKAKVPSHRKEVAQIEDKGNLLLQTVH
jgi:hypothetical protein